MAGNKPKGKHFSYRPPLALEGDLLDIAEASGVPKTKIVDWGVEKIVPEMMKRYQKEVEALRRERMEKYQIPRAQHLHLNDEKEKPGEPPGASDKPAGATEVTTGGKSSIELTHKASGQSDIAEVATPPANSDQPKPLPGVEKVTVKALLPYEISKPPSGPGSPPPAPPVRYKKGKQSKKP